MTQETNNVGKSKQNTEIGFANKMIKTHSDWDIGDKMFKPEVVCVVKNDLFISNNALLTFHFPVAQIQLSRACFYFISFYFWSFGSQLVIPGATPGSVFKGSGD